MEFFFVFCAAGISHALEFTGAAPLLYHNTCPKGLVSCTKGDAAIGCCPRGTFCYSGYCCPSDGSCTIYVQTFPTCASSDYTLYEYLEKYSVDPDWFCCLPGKEGYLTVGHNPACGDPPIAEPTDPDLVVTSIDQAIPTGGTGETSATPSKMTSASSGETLTPSEDTSTVTDSRTSSNTAVSGTDAPRPSTASHSSAAESTTGDTSSNRGLSVGAIVGIVLGVVFGLAAFATVAWLGIRYGVKKAIESVATGAQPAPAPAYVESGAMVEPKSEYTTEGRRELDGAHDGDGERNELYGP